MSHRKNKGKVIREKFLVRSSKVKGKGKGIKK
jgi:hypothetical protein